MMLISKKFIKKLDILLKYTDHYTAQVINF